MLVLDIQGLITDNVTVIMHDVLDVRVVNNVLLV